MKRYCHITGSLLEFKRVSLDAYQEVYEKMYYFSCFENSQIELINRDVNNEIKFAKDFFELARQELPLYAVNHPTKIVIEKLGKKILSHLGYDVNLGSSFFVDPFISSTIWPVYEEVSKMHNLPYSTSMLFLPQVESGMKALDLQELVVRSFEKYRSVGHKEFMKIGLAQELEAIPL
ncbi:WcbI family polysaccharide biosynthesis putative acetyltransferase [Acinetobacter brisouii]|uniref:WcbI family polysaccharide biosynthesis putative acetyltransferase n=1 Tax=Acinetobacter brisouii TaxID=396323 RepID=UPI00124D1A8D|nr:WcbI family polysaccharide biosynthesis putative acetyltransferase [Acinetobacter brisouii]